MNEHDLPERKAFLEATEASLNKSDFLTALSLAESRLKGMPGDLDARIAIARVWIEQERFGEAGEIIGEMEEILASLSLVYISMGDIYLKKGMTESAHAFYRTYVSLNPDTPMAREISERLTGVSQPQATDEGAIAEKEVTKKGVPDHLQTVTLAELYARQGHLRMAEEILEAILSRGPHHVKAAEMLREIRGRIAAQEESGGPHVQVALVDAGKGIAAREEPQDRALPEMFREVGETIVAREKPGETPAQVMFVDAGEGIAAREATGEKREARLIRELERLRERITGRKDPADGQAAVIAELSRWLNNIGRLSSHAT